MPTAVQFRRGTTTQHASFTGAEGEVTVDTSKDTLVVHDGSTQGGFEIARADLSNTSAIALTNISVTDAGGDGSLSYNNSTGVITYTGPSAAEVQAHITAGTGVSISSGAVSIGQAVGTSDTPSFAGVTLTGNSTVSGNIVPSVDNTYALGSALKQWSDIFVGPGSLYVNGQQVVSDNSGTITISADTNQDVAVQTSGSGDIKLDPTGSGIIQIKGTLQIEDGTNVSNSAGNPVSFASGIKTDSITTKTADTTLALSGNGTGTIALNDNTAITGTLSTTSNASIGGNLTVTGNLQIDGTTTTINSTSLSVDDLNITVASGAVNAAAANGAGITVDGASATFTYASTGDKWTMNKPLDMGANNITTTGTITGDLTGDVTGDVSGNAGTVTNGVYTTDTGTVTNAMLAGSIADSKLSTISTAGKVSNSATTATDANTASAIVARDASGNFAAGTITAALSGNASTATTLTDLTATVSELNVLDGITATVTELNYTDGVTSAIQTQLDGKSSTSHNHTLDSLSNTTITTNSAGEILKWNGTAWINNTLAEAGISATGHTHTVADITDLTATATELNTLDGITATVTELNYVDGVTSAIQTQLDGKSSTSHNHTLDGLSNTTITTNSAGEILKWNGSAWINNTLAEAGISATGHTHTVADITDLTATAAELNYTDGVTSNIQTQLDGKSSTSHNHTLDSLSNTTITTNSAGEILKWNGSAWINNTLAEAGISATSHNHTLDSLSNTTITTNSAGEILKWNGSAWINNTLAEAGISATGHTHTVADITDLTATASELNALDGITATVTELNYTDGVTSNIQTQLNAKAPLASPTFTGTVNAANLSLSGNLTVNGTTTTVNSTTVTLDDPIITLGGDTAPSTDDNKDRGVEFRWHNGTAAKVGFFGFDDSSGKLTFIPDATNTSEVFSGTKGTVDANIEWADVLSKPDPTITLGGDLTGSVTLTDLASGTLTATIAANSVALGTDTTGNYVGAGATSGNGISGSVSSEGGTFTVTSNATNANTASTIVFRDASGNFSAGTVTAALSGNASTATTLQTSRTINGVSFNGSANITVEPYIEDDEGTAATRYIVFTDNSAGGYKRLNEDSSLNYNPSTNTLVAGTFSGSGASLSSLNASNLSSGTVPDARISGSYTGMTNLTGSGTVDFAKFLGNAADTVTAPSFSWTGDTNTGIYAPAADTLGITTAGVERVRVDSTGKVGIGNAAPAQALHVTGQIIATSEITAYYSDERLKEKVEDVTNALDMVKSLKAFRYTNNELAQSLGFEGKELQLGLSAQDVQKVAPEIVKLAPFDMVRDEEDNVVSKSGENYLTLDYGKLVPVLIEAIKEQQEQIEELKKMLDK